MTRFSFCIMLLLAVPAIAQDGIVVDHSANRTGGRVSDTSTGTVVGWDAAWQRAADDITVGAPATIRRVTWWGLYQADTVPTVEVMRIRLYDARPSDGLPGTVLSEENLFDALRTPTGIIVPPVYGSGFSGGAEYQFEADLTMPISLSAETPYWMEIVQIGDPDTTFYWRGANAEQTGTAVIYRTSGDWIASTGRDMAFQLSTVPEPGTLTLIVMASALAARAGRLRRW